jgi:hypothetical protein
LVLEQDKIETKDEKDRIDRLEQELAVSYEKIPKSMHTTRLMVTQNIDQIVQTIDQYRHEIEHLWE